MNLPSSIRDQETYEMPKTERKARNNYVTCKDPSSRKDTLVLNFNHGSDKEKEIGRAMFSRLMPVGKGGFGKVWKV